MTNVVNADAGADLGALVTSASRLSDREIQRRLGVATWQYCWQMAFVLIMVTLFGGAAPLMWISQFLGHKVVVPFWKDPVYGPIFLCLCMVLYSALFALITLSRRRNVLAVYERGFSVGGISFPYNDIIEVRLGRKDGKLVSGLLRLNAAIPLAQNQGAVQLLHNSSVLSLTLVMNDGRVVPLHNFFACFPNDALESVVRKLERKLVTNSSSSLTPDDN